MKHIVKSREGIEFVVESEPRTAPFDIEFAKARPAAELRLHGDFTEVRDLELVPGAYDVAVRQSVASPEFVFEGPRIVGPLERRAAFKVIKGGKP